MSNGTVNMSSDWTVSRVKAVASSRLLLAESVESLGPDSVVDSHKHFADFPDSKHRRRAFQTV